MVEKNHAQNRLSYCTTCMILRPPRAFHCASCGICVESHDHHCPWVGTCVGLRNVKYFIKFLLFTSNHAIITFGVSLNYFLNENKKNEDKKFDIMSKSVCIFSGVFGLTLFLFGLYQLFNLGFSNISSNEYIRERWNGNPSNL